MGKKLLLALLFLVLFNLVSAVVDDPPADYWQIGTDFDYYIAIQGGTERPQASPKYTGTNFIYDIDIYRTKTADDKYIDPFTGNVITPPQYPHFLSELWFCIWKGYCIPVGANDVLVVNAWAQSNPQFSNAGNRIFVRVLNNNPGNVVSFSISDFEATRSGGSGTISCTGGWQPATTIPAGDTIDFYCDIDAPDPALPYTTGTYSGSVSLENIQFDAGCTACKNNTSNDSDTVYFIVIRPFAGTQIPETSGIVVLLVALAVIVILRQKR